MTGAGGGPLDFERDEQDAVGEEEAARPRPTAPAPARPPGRSRFTWVLGIAVLLVGITIMLNAVGGTDAPPGGPVANAVLPPFATPAADSNMEGDANVATEETKGTDAGERPACQVRGVSIVNVCELYERGPLVLAIFPADAKRCRAVLRQFDRLRGEFAGRVTFAAVGSRGDRASLRGHGFPVGWDHDGAIATVYGLAGCPQITFARQGGRVRETTHRELTDAELRTRVQALVR